MKKPIFTLIIILTTSVAFAQFEQGRILAGGSIGLSTKTYKQNSGNTTTTTSKGFDVNFGPKVGYFVIDRLAFGLGIDAGSSIYKSKISNSKSTYSNIGISPFVRYYLKPGIFFQGQTVVGSEKFKSTIDNITTTSKSSTFDWSIGAGYAYFLNKKVAIEPFIGYGANSSKAKGTDDKRINSGLFINVGFQIYLDTKK